MGARRGIVQKPKALEVLRGMKSYMMILPRSPQRFLKDTPRE